MTPDHAATASAGAISELASHFMFDSATYERGGELGFPGLSFYFAGRCGVLGRVPADVVTAALVFFHPDTVAAAWTAAVEVMDPRDASAVFAACAHTWAERIPTTIDLERLAELSGRLIAAAPPAGRILFAGWRAMPEPEDLRALAVHRLQVLRELRGGTHAISVLAAGIDPGVAVGVDSAPIAAVFGWPHVSPTDVDRNRVAAATKTTNALLAPVFASLDADERATFVALADEMRAAVAR